MCVVIPDCEAASHKAPRSWMQSSSRPLGRGNKNSGGAAGGKVRKNANRTTMLRTSSSTGTHRSFGTLTAGTCKDHWPSPRWRKQSAERSTVSPMRTPVRRVNNRALDNRSLRRRSSAFNRTSSSGLKGARQGVLGPRDIPAPQQPGPGWKPVIGHEVEEFAQMQQRCRAGIGVQRLTSETNPLHPEILQPAEAESPSLLCI
jgi:hypothetical protein